MLDKSTAPVTANALATPCWERPKDRHQLLAEKLGYSLLGRGPGALPCLGCEHQMHNHAKDDTARFSAERGSCDHCDCVAFVWDEFEEDPDAAWDALKDDAAYESSYYEGSDWEYEGSEF